MISPSMDFFLVIAFFLVACLFTSFPLVAGYWLGRRQHRKSGDGDSYVGVIVGAILGLLAFLLAFTFSMAASRYEVRRQVVLQEANDIGTTYLRAAFLPEPLQSEIRSLLQRYVGIRVRAVQAHPTVQKVEESILASEELLDQIWRKAAPAVQHDATPINALFVVSLNNMIDTHSKRVMAGMHSRIPAGLWIGLIFLSVIGLSCAGYQAGVAARTRSIIMIGLIAAFAGVLTLIADLDHPSKGLLKSSQDAMISLQNSMTLH